MIMDKLILASKSPRRREILNMLEIPYMVFEPPEDSEIPIKNVKRVVHEVIKNSRLKAVSVYPEFRNGLILGVDTVVVFGNRVMGKPEDEEEARFFLKALSGNTHKVYSGTTLMNVKDEKMLSRVSTTYVKFKKLSSYEIDSYIDTNEWIDKAGGYAIQGRASFFIEGIVGSYYNVVGLPVETLYYLLNRFNYFNSDGLFHPLRRL